MVLQVEVVAAGRSRGGDAAGGRCAEGARKVEASGARGRRWRCALSQSCGEQRGRRQDPVGSWLSSEQKCRESVTGCALSGMGRVQQDAPGMLCGFPQKQLQGACRELGWPPGVAWRGPLGPQADHTLYTLSYMTAYA